MKREAGRLGQGRVELPQCPFLSSSKCVSWQTVWHRSSVVVAVVHFPVAPGHSAAAKSPDRRCPRLKRIL
eukprot:15443955-Heterocapsa_arctica.AAC.1